MEARKTHYVDYIKKQSCCQWVRRHDKIGKILHLKLVKNCNFEVRDKWYEDEEPKSVLGNEC